MADAGLELVEFGGLHKERCSLITFMSCVLVYVNDLVLLLLEMGCFAWLVLVFFFFNFLTTVLLPTSNRREERGHPCLTPSTILGPSLIWCSMPKDGL